MKNIGIFYGSTTGNTAALAEKISGLLEVTQVNVHDVAHAAPSAVADYDILLLGASTWGDGDMQDDMHDFIDGLQSIDLKGKKIALFGTGDDTMSDTFCNAVGQMYEMLLPTGAEFIGGFNTEGYSFKHTDADVNGEIVGLLIDNANHEELTDKRVAQWCEKLKKEI